MELKQCECNQLATGNAKGFRERFCEIDGEEVARGQDAIDFIGTNAGYRGKLFRRQVDLSEPSSEKQCESPSCIGTAVSRHLSIYELDAPYVEDSGLIQVKNSVQ